MKKLLVSILFIFLLVGIVSAETVLIPNNVKEVKSATFSSGGGKTAIIYIKVLCLMDSGKSILYMAKKGSVSGFFGMGRWTIPDKIEFKKSSQAKDKIIWKK